MERQPELITTSTGNGHVSVPLPLLGRPLHPETGNPLFAHPAEQEIARLLTFFGLRWTYEPTSFALRRHADGTIAEAFAPDFFLPDLNLYLELTTMRQKLVTRKNRKARLLRELYPNVNLRLIYRRDYLRLTECYLGEMRRPDGPELMEVVRNEEEIAAEVERISLRLLARLQRSRRGAGEVTLLAISRSSRRFQHMVADRLRAAGIDATCLESHLSRADNIAEGSRLRLSHGNLARLRATPVVLVETLVSSGLTLGHSQRWLAERGVIPIETVALFARLGCRIGSAHLDHVSFEAPNDVLAGLGLQLRAAYADLPYVARLRAGSGYKLDLFDLSSPAE